jgi:UPF0755 protein
MKEYKVNGKKHRRWPKILIVVAVLLAAVTAIGVSATRRMYIENLKPVNTADTKQSVFVIASGSSVEQISGDLQSQKLIRSSGAFKQYLRSQQLTESLKAGTYRLSPSQSSQEIAETITSGKVAIDLFTILPGRRLDQIRQDFIEAGFSEASVDNALNPANYSGHPALVDKPASASLEGYLYPDSFQKTAETNPSVIVAASLDEMNSYLTPDIRAAYAAQGLTTYQALSLASIIEKEVASQSDRATAAQVFLKRLKSNIMLGSDVTAIYGAVKDNVNLPDNYADAAEVAIAHDSPYNTRMHSGLPPGPISNVTKSGIQAVAHPSSTDYLFFVAGDDGVTYFSRTEAEHESLAQQHCIKLCGR